MFFKYLKSLKKLFDVVYESLSVESDYITARRPTPVIIESYDHCRGIPVNTVKIRQYN